MTEPVEPDGTTPPTVEADEKKGERSTIRFPYTDIDDAIDVAATIWEHHGAGAMPLDQLAVALGGQSTKSGAFRTKIATASTFGAVKSARGAVQLLPLGTRLADPNSRAAAMVESFLQVPLYKELYDRYHQLSLPGDAGLENDIRALGVVASQADRARQTFMRSAQKAGFFWGGRTRLVMPSNAMLHPKDETPPPTPPPLNGGDGGNMADSPLLQGLWAMLPKNGEFPAEKRAQWFKALAVNLDLVYGTSGAELVVQVQPIQAQGAGISQAHLNLSAGPAGG